MTVECLSVRVLLERYAAGLNQAERLVLERHLTTCSECREQSILLTGMRKLSDRASVQGSVPRERLIARAIQRAEHGERALPVSALPRKRLAQAAFAVALAAALIVAALTARRVGQRAPESSTSQAPERSRLVSGGVSAGQRTLAPGEAIPEDTPLFLDRSSDVALEHARVRAAEPSAGQWSASHASFSLDHGAIDVSVDPRPKRRFSVRTSHFAVEVLGTEFQVSLSGVRVSRGLVRVLSPMGEELARVAAGQTWQLAEPEPEPEPALPAASAAPAESVRSLSAAERLAFARHALSTREFATAKQELASVLAAHPSLQEQAEAHMLLGDWARLSGDFARASREYLGVCARFRALPLAETALFSAARAEASAGNQARSQRLLAQYLAQYPNGQFRQEATARTAAAGVPGQK